MGNYVLAKFCMEELILLSPAQSRYHIAYAEVYIYTHRHIHTCICISPAYIYK